MLPQFGASWDEPLHRNWGQLFWLFWRTDNNTFLESMPGFGMYYGSLYYFAGWVISEFLVRSYSLPLYQASHVLNLVTFALSAGFLFAVVRAWFTMRVAWLTLLLFLLFPPLIAHAHYNPKDIPLMLMTLPAVWAALRAIEKPSLKSVGLAGITFGLCFVTKVSSVLLLPIFFVAYLVHLLLSAHPLRLPPVLRMLGRHSLLIPVFFVAALAAIFVAWPTLWKRPDLLLGALGLFTGDYWPGQVLYMGTEYGGAALPWHYIPFQFVLAVPLLTLVCALTGIVLSIRCLWKRDDIAKRAMLLSWFFIPLLVSLKPELVRYDGMRQFFFTVPALLMLAALGLRSIFQWLGERWQAQRWITPVVMAAVIGWLLLEIIRVHPYEGAYVSEIGRAALAPHIERSIDLEYWGASYREGIEWLIENAEPNPVICVPTAGLLVEWYHWRPDFTFECTAKSTYLMYFTRYSESKRMLAEKLPSPVFTISRYDSDLLYIYKLR